MFVTVAHEGAQRPYSKAYPPISKHYPSIAEISSHTQRRHFAVCCCGKKTLRANFSDHEGFTLCLEINKNPDFRFEAEVVPSISNHFFGVYGSIVTRTKWFRCDVDKSVALTYATLHAGKQKSTYMETHKMILRFLKTKIPSSRMSKLDLTMNAAVAGEADRELTFVSLTCHSRK